MPWFYATCRQAVCNFHEPFEGENEKEAREKAVLDHKDSNPECPGGSDLMVIEHEESTLD
ncbi:MAG: hypothetical protein WAX85_01525 [Minisyncoccia bacterium]